MKQRKGTRFLSAVLALLTVVLTVPPVRAASTIDTITGEVTRESETITYNGRNTGVTHTYIELASGSKYGMNKIHAIEFDLANRNLTLEAVNSGTYLVSAQTVTNALSSYNTAHTGQTALAAVNGDLWMTKVHSGTSVTTSVLKVPRGVTIIDGEIWSSQQIGNENLGATNDEQGDTTPPKYAFGVTSAYQPVVGSPVVSLSLKNVTRGITVAADGLNRLPADESLIVYNDRLNTANYALSDAYEIVLQMSDTAFAHGKTLTGKVIEIYPSGQGGTATLGAGRIVLTARGSRMSDLSGKFSVGNTVEISCTLTDAMGKTDLWRTVTDAIGGHRIIVQDGRVVMDDTSTSRYASTIVGVKHDGSVQFVTVDRNSGESLGLSWATMGDFCREMGFNTAFHLDGGGSATCVTRSGTEYVVRNSPSDGSPRAVINSLAVVWNTTARTAQGSMDHVVNLNAFDGTNVTFTSAMTRHLSDPNDTEYAISGGALSLSASTSTSDPYISLSYADATPAVYADDYRYVALRVRASGLTTSRFKLYFSTNDLPDPTEELTGSFTMTTDGAYHTYFVDMGANPNWTGKLRSIRLDFIDGNCSAGETVEIQSIRMMTQKAVQVTLDANGGLLTASKEMTGVIGKAYGTLPVPKKPGCTFLGWYTAKAGGTKVTALTTVTVRDDHTLYARYEVDDYKLTFVADGKTVEERTIRYLETYGALPVAEKAGYTFDGWYTAEIGGTKITESTVFYACEDQVLYARLIAPYATVDLFVDGAEYDAIETAYGEPYGTLPVPKKTGHTFLGWYTAETGGTQVTEDTTYTAAGDSALYARFEIATYTVSLLSHNDLCETREITYLEPYGTLPTPERDGCTFVGWYTAGIGGTEVTAETLLTRAEDHAIYARFAPIEEIAVPKFAIDLATARPGETVQVFVRFENNPGVISGTLAIEYDADKLELIGAKNGDVFDCSMVKGQDYTAQPFLCVWASSSSEPFSSDGVLVRYTFRVLDTAPVGTAAVRVYAYNGDMTDFDLQRIPTDPCDGAVRIVDSSLGDFDGDGAVDNTDATLMMRYLAQWEDLPVYPENGDITGDGVISAADVTVLLRHLAGWETILRAQ